jgi:hypothetical protein
MSEVSHQREEELLSADIREDEYATAAQRDRELVEMADEFDEAV